MNKDLKEGIIVSLVAVAAFLIYKQATKPKDITKTEVKNEPEPVKVGLPVEPVDPEKPMEQVMINVPLFN